MFGFILGLQMTGIFNPISNMALKQQKAKHVEISYHSESLIWK